MSVYTAVATATGEGRSGHTRTDDGLIDLDLAVPKELGGPGGLVNPEQLFAAGYAACFLNALTSTARREKAEISDAAVTAEVGLTGEFGQGFSLSVVLDVELGGVEQETAERLVEAAHRRCPYSNATRGNIPVQLKVTTL